MRKITETRVQNGILSGVESRILRWIVQRLPESIGPDHLTLLGLLAMAGAGLAYGFSGPGSTASASGQFLHLPELAGGQPGWNTGQVSEQAPTQIRVLRGPYHRQFRGCLSAGGTGLLGADDVVRLRDYLQRIASSGPWGGSGSLHLLLSIRLNSSYLSCPHTGCLSLPASNASPTLFANPPSISVLPKLRLLLGLRSGTWSDLVLFKPFVSLWGYRWLLFDVGGAVGILILALVLVISTTMWGNSNSL